MRDNFCVVDCKTSKLATGMLVTIWINILFLLHYSNFYIVIKLASFAIVSIYMLYIFFQYNYHGYTSKYEILFELQNVIIWNNHTTQLVTIKKWYLIGNICAIIKAKNQNINKTLIILKDSCPNEVFKQIMKRIKWSSIQTS